MESSKCVRVLLGVLLVGSLATVGCKKSEDPATVPVPSTTAAAAPAPTTTAAAAGTESPSGAPSASEAPATPPPVATNTQTTTKHETIDACCSALSAIQKSGKTAAAKAKAAQAAAVCPGIAKLVKAGTTARTAGLAQIRSAMTGFDVPGECK
ncbi:MAG: hypothetical protein U0441_02255 [Polyangiaceae bacterium]